VNGQDAEITLAQNNGDIARIKYFISGTLQHSQTFQYDQVNRLRYAVEHNNGVYNDASRAWYQTFDYDRHGNRGINVTNTSDNADAANSALQLADFSEANNRITRAGFVYDAVGNLIAEPGKSYTYDGENRMVMTTVIGGGTSQYVYDGNGRRVKKIVGGVTTRFEYGAKGKLIAERNESNGAVTKEYFYKGGQLLATTTTGTTYEYATADHLGSPRAWTDNSGNLVAGGRHDYLPFGEELFAGHGVRTGHQGYATNTQADGQRKQFGSKERDAETGLDYFLARHYSNIQGRFVSVDPIIVTPERFFDPQQFNLYGYVRNNPLRFIDPTGEKLTISGDLEEVKKQLREILGTNDAEKRINVNEQTNTITIDLSGIDLEQNEGAKLLSDVIESNKVYDVSIGPSVETLGGQLSLVPTAKGGSSVVNLDNNPDDRLKSGKRDIDKPKKGIDDQIGINFDFRHKNSESTTNLPQALDFTVTFHELAEAYAKVDGNMQYDQAHKKAEDRETKLREQRPYLKGYNPGSGPGTKIIIKK
jgi:RHS repeat-associated protein